MKTTTKEIIMDEETRAELNKIADNLCEVGEKLKTTETPYDLRQLSKALAMYSSAIETYANIVDMK
jgi:uncharacterized protein YaaR (DUF327 family)